MSFNRVLAKKMVGTALKDGKSVTLSVATETSHWKRLNTAIEPVSQVLEKSFAEYNKPLPTGTTDVCVRESDHQSDLDSRDHLTVVCTKESGEAETAHIPVSKK
ncbi:hypothetical protein F5883DRAFT_539591 [Diaporthe sp. PMI_573]|nr:hypothetical protein F5883DRAFT_539591 [Diaporthaceae sp. PMI_573]